MKQTANYKLNKPEETDVVNIDDLNTNFDTLDAEVFKKVDKLSGKDLSSNDYTTAEKNKLAGIASGANNYSHPSTHPWSMITGAPTSYPANGGNAATVNGKTVLENVPAGAKFTDTVYAHPSSHPFSMITGAPTSYPANGGNADTVDGFHAASFMKYYDLNTINIDIEGGNWIVNISDTSHGTLPAGVSWSWLNVMQFEAGHFITQFGTTSSGNATLYMRTKYRSDASWGAWQCFGSGTNVISIAPASPQAGTLWIW